MKQDNTPEWMRPVVMEPLTQAFPQFEEVKEFRSKVCLFSHDRSRVFDVVSPRYKLIEHGKVYESTRSALEQYFDTKRIEEHVRTTNGGARFLAEFKLPIEPIKLGKNDISDITVLLRNSYDRAWQFGMTLGAFRLVCSNGMKIGEQFAGLTGRHVGDMGDGLFFDALTGMIQRAPKLRDLWRGWADTRMTPEDVRELLTDKHGELRFPKKYLMPILENEQTRSKWHVYNELTRFSTHDTKNLARRVEFDDTIAALFYRDGEEDEEGEE